MRTRNCLLIAFCFIFLCGKLYAQPTGSEDRMYWVQTLTRIADKLFFNTYPDFHYYKMNEYVKEITNYF